MKPSDIKKLEKEDGAETKIGSRAEIEKRVMATRAAGQRIGFTSGVFDLLHCGHLTYLEEARALCDFLVVGVNSDRSVRANKGADRPINSAQDRARLLAGLAVVDAVFIFDEQNNNENVKILKPNFYIKAGDYDKSRLTSASFVEESGGKVVLVSMVGGVSTTKLIERIQGRAATQSLPIKPPDRRPAIFVDRDGVINEEVEYLHEPEKFKVIPGALEALVTLQQAGFRIVVVTNQAGIGLGYFTVEDFYRVNKKLLQSAKDKGLIIDRVYFCPHGVTDSCTCRKPAPGMIQRGAEDLNIDLARSYMIGDKTADIIAGERAGVKTVLVGTGHGGKDQEFSVDPTFEVETLKDAAVKILHDQ
jgi:rfaE bifunctional protein nucleotidyltransferase chain/domain